MQVRLVRPNVSTLKTDVLVLLQAEGQKRPEMEVPLSAFYEAGEIKGKLLEFTLLHGVAGFAATRVLLAGSGKPEKLDSAAVGKLAAGAMRFLKGKGVSEVTFALDLDFANAANVAALAQGVLVGVWEPDQLKTEKGDSKPIDSVAIAIPGSADQGIETALEHGRIIGEALNLARDIAVEPPNALTPAALADRARAVAKESGLFIDVLDQDRMRQMGMGALLGVAQGSAEPPAMIVMQYRPEKATAEGHLGLIGKGVTFDTGGISIKPSEGMEKMKYDMAAGAAVIGAMQAIARLKPGVAVTGIVPAVENMPGSKAQRPGDIVKSLSGKTIEILNTDAEGRLILADAITYAKQLGCTHLVDAATLTGAIVVALGHTSSGVFTNNDALLDHWMAAGKAAGEKMWHMPLDDEYLEQLKTVYADLQNIGSRWGGACTAAMFLREFAGETPWVHVDVAGTAWLDDAKPSMAKGPTGIPLATFVSLAMDWK
ncbi:MAG: leucyl aminopeptidase [Bryobacterales bacterium]|jgi:leucyl aminopeptidase|nr:leucyl aminopeptidase [Bryobacterales bacterium]